MFNNFSPYSTFPVQSPYDRIAGNQPQQMFNPYQPNQPQQPQSFQQNTNITFVNGIEGAKAYRVSPNSSVLLMDSGNSKFYVKSTDGLGVAKLTSYCFLEEGNSPTESSTSAVPVEGVWMLWRIITECILAPNYRRGMLSGYAPFNYERKG